MKKFSFVLGLILIVIGSIFLIGETVVRIFSPTRYLYPRYSYSEEYGSALFKNVRMVHGCPGRFKFHYTINEYGYRGEAIPLADRYDKPNVIILGDSYSFGMGVNDGEEYAAVLQRELGGRYNVVNLATKKMAQQPPYYKYLDPVMQPELAPLLLLRQCT